MPSESCPSSGPSCTTPTWTCCWASACTRRRAPRPAQILREARWPLEDRRLYLTYAAYQVHQRGRGRALRQGGARPWSSSTSATWCAASWPPFWATTWGWSAAPGPARGRRTLWRSWPSAAACSTPTRRATTFGDHLTVQEFLAANYLVDNLRGSGEWTAFLQAHAGQSWWREVLLLMAGYLLQWPQQARRFLLDELGKPAGGGRRAGLRPGLGRARPARDPGAARGLARQRPRRAGPPPGRACCGRTRR